MKFLRFFIPLSLIAAGAGAQERGEATARAVVNLLELSRQERSQAPEVPQRRAIHAPLRRPHTLSAPAASMEAPPPAAPEQQPLASGANYTAFPGLLDDLRRVPPDTNGAVGPQHIVAMLNSEVQVQDRSGTVLAKLTLDEFWARLGPFGKNVFDPRLVYDANGRRWVASAAADSRLPSSALLVGVSQTEDPTGDWSLFRFDIAGGWADFPLLSFTHNWAVVAVSIYNDENYIQTRIYAFDKAALYEGNRAPYALFQESGGSLTPVVDYDDIPDRAWLVQGGSGGLRLAELSGAAGAESYNPSAATIQVDWTPGPADGGNLAPQAGSSARIDAGDSRMQNCLLRNGSLWCAHTVFLPAGAPDHAAVEWFQLEPAAAQVLQRGRIEDPAVSYAFPSIAVNRYGDVLIGYTEFTGGQYPSAAFSFRLSTDPPNTMQPSAVYKPGEASYRSLATADNRWGDYSATVPDPLDDGALWTLQEYAATPLNDAGGRWGTWWARVVPR